MSTRPLPAPSTLESSLALPLSEALPLSDRTGSASTLNVNLHIDPSVAWMFSNLEIGISRTSGFGRPPIVLRGGANDFSSALIKTLNDTISDKLRDTLPPQGLEDIPG